MHYLIHSVFMFAADNLDSACNAVICSSNTNIPGGTSDLGLATAKIMKLVFELMGGIAVIVVMIGGLQYSLSAGDPKRTAHAKETILYAIIGIAISLAAYAIVAFITAGLSK